MACNNTYTSSDAALVQGSVQPLSHPPLQITRDGLTYSLQQQSMAEQRAEYDRLTGPYQASESRTGTLQSGADPVQGTIENQAHNALQTGDFVSAFFIMASSIVVGWEGLKSLADD